MTLILLLYLVINVSDLKRRNFDLLFYTIHCLAWRILLFVLFL